MWTLRTKILSGYAMVLGLAGLVLGLALWNIHRLGNASDNILQENYRSILAAEEMLNSLARQENAAMQLVIGVEAGNVSVFSESEQAFLLWLERAKANVTIEGEQDILNRIEASYVEFLFRLAKFRNLYQGDRERGLNFYRDQLAAQAQAVREACHELHDINRRTMEAASQRAQNITRTAVWTTLVSGLFVIGGTLATSVWLSNRIVRPVQSLSAATERVAAGDYDVAIEPESQDEVGQLARKFQVMLTKLRAYHELNLRKIVGEQKKAEVILRTIDDGVLVVGADRKVLSLNPTAARVLAWRSGSGEDRDFAEVVENEELARSITAMLKSQTALESETTGRTIAVENRDGQPSHFEYTLTPIAAADGDLIGLIVLFRNVTALKELDRLKTEFVMTASHELRSPLTSIAMSIELLREQAMDKLDESGRQLLDIAHEELERLRALVEELLDLSKIESGRLEIELADISVQSVLETAVAPFRVQAQQQSISLTLDIPDNLPKLHADPNKLTWVVTNLVGNALRYARREVVVSAQQAGPWLNLYVKDDGQGIPYEQQDRIFDKFVQVSGDKRPGGAGLGLAISREIVKAHQGNIWVESEPGKGSLFIVALRLGSTTIAPGHVLKS